MSLLAVTTSTHHGGVAVLAADRIVGSATYVDPKGHAEQLFGAIERALAGEAAEPGALDEARSRLRALACDLGPGSFTGVRVGVASLKGLAVSMGLPLVGVGSLEVMAHAAFRLGLVPASSVVLATLDAKKGEIFAGAYDQDGVEVLAPTHIARSEAGALLAKLPPGSVCRVVGEIAAELPELLPLFVRDSATFLPNATEIARLAARRLASTLDADPALLEPCYVRAPDAKPMTPELC